jgi:hypothetical protein
MYRRPCHGDPAPSEVNISKHFVAIISPQSDCQISSSVILMGVGMRTGGHGSIPDWRGKTAADLLGKRVRVCGTLTFNLLRQAQLMKTRGSLWELAAVSAQTPCDATSCEPPQASHLIPGGIVADQRH